MMLVRIGLKHLRFTLIFCSVLLAAPLAHAQTSQQVTIDGARKVLADLHHDKAFGNAKTLLREAKAVLIVPKLVKGGFFVGGEGGNGVLMVRGKGGWSDPAFYALGSASFGLQIGLEQSEVVMLLMTQKAVDGVMHNQFKLGAQAGISVVTLGSGVEGAISGASLPDVVVWSSSTGLYGGLTLNGSVIKSQPDKTAEYYGRSVTIRQVLYGGQSNPKAAALRREINALG
ncbi:MAG TPA: lipid-binding SYLF domain-containing protein [Rhodopila sp.]|jgi:lipid-binding SYLF domain-containing protein|nr:lipid-binding SYLF domain-containing protein [Rhodopila sp.]